MACLPPPFARAVLAEATRIAPTRRTSSDGICADAAHYAGGGDHVPDARGVPHAVDISHSVPGAPFWEARYGRFDAQAAALKIAARRDPRVEYLVANFGGPDMIWNPSVSWGWRQNGSYKTEHRSHLHVSYTVAAEQSTAPFFTTPEEDMPLTDADVNKVVAALRPVIREQALAAVRNALGGYNDQGEWEDGLAAATYRNDHGLSKP